MKQKSNGIPVYGKCLLCVCASPLLKVLAKLKSVTHELESKELDTAARNLQVGGGVSGHGGVSFFAAVGRWAFGYTRTW